MLGRFAGKLLTMTLGWAGTLLFGRVPKDRQVLLAAITFGALIWAVVLFGVIWPDAGTFILAFVPIPPWVEEDWVRLGMIVGALAIPLALSAATLRLLRPEDRPKDPGALVSHFLRGYPLAAAMAAMIAFLAAIGIVRKVSSLARRWTDAHIPIVAKPGRYDELARDLDTPSARQALTSRLAQPRRCWSSRSCACRHRQHPRSRPVARQARSPGGS